MTKYLLGFLLLAGTGCTRIHPVTDPPLEKNRIGDYELPLSFLREQGNPTVYLFHANLPKAREAVLKSLGAGKFHDFGLSMQGPERPDGVAFLLEGTPSGLHPLTSKSYYEMANGQKHYLEVWRSFEITLSDYEDRTGVSVSSRHDEPFRDGPAVCCIGWIGLPLAVFSKGELTLVGTSQYPSTTVEEYEILLLIGKSLGEEGMPSGRYPQILVKER